MSGPADLELNLRRRDTRSYALEMRFSHPDSDVDVRLIQDGPTLVCLDLEKLRGLEVDAEGYGRCLGEALLADRAVRSAFEQTRASTASLDVPLRVRLFLDPSAPELHRLRWELLRHPDNGALLFAGESIYFSRYLSSLDWRPVRLRPRGEWRALVAIANPRGLDRYQPNGRPLATIDVEAELARAQGALAEIPVTAMAGPGTATLSHLTEQLRDGFDVLYLVCHGALIGGEPHLWLEDEAGAVSVVSGEELVTYLEMVRQRPSLIVLASCQSAGGGGEPGTGDEGALAALGPRLAEMGIPAVVAMQGNVGMTTLARFMPVFFAELRRDGCIDRAMAAARGAVAERPDAWAPVLFMRSRSGRVWYVPGFAGDRPGFEQWPAILRSVSQGRCTPILGPGLLESLWGSTREIARRWAETYRFPMAPHNRDDLPQVAQFLAVNQDPQFPRDELEQYLREEMLARYGADMPPDAKSLSLDDLVALAGAIRRSRDPAEPHRVLARLAVPIYLTTNQDRLLSTALEEVGKSPQVALCPWNEAVEREHMDETWEPSVERPLVYHLFGRLDEPDSVVLTEDDYFDYLIGVTRNADLIPAVVRRVLADTALLFLGFQLDDWDFRVLFRSIIRQEGGSRRRRYAHVAVQIDPEEGRFLEPERARSFLEQYFQADDIRIYWGSAEDFIRDLLARLPTEADASAPVAATAGRG